MPSAPRAKQWVAARNFKHGRKVYRQGDPVTKLGTIELLSRRGDRWITRAPKPAEAEPANPPADDPTTPTPEG